MIMIFVALSQCEKRRGLYEVAYNRNAKVGCKEATRRNEWTGKNDLLLFELPLRLSGTMEVDVIASILNMSLDEIKQHIKKEKPLFVTFFVF